MKSKAIIISIVAFIFLMSGCTTLYNDINVQSTLNLSSNSRDIQTMNAQQLYGVNNNDLCVSYYQNKTTSG